MAQVTVYTLAGEEIDTGHWGQGRPVMINFWATWCPPCMTEMPALQALHDAQGSSGVSIVAVNYGEDAQHVQTFLTASDLSLPVYLDPQGAAAAAFGVNYLPTTLMVDAEGVIVARYLGPMDEQQFEAAAAALH